MRSRLLRPLFWRHCRDGHSSFAYGGGAMGTKKFMQLTGWEHQQEPLAHGLGAPAFRTIKFAGCKGAELLRHGLKLHQVSQYIKQHFGRILVRVNGVEDLFSV